MPYGMMWDWHGGWGILHWLFWLAIIALVIWAIVIIARAGNRGRADNTPPLERRSKGLDILEERYARGEIQRDEYLEKKRDLIS